MNKNNFPFYTWVPRPLGILVLLLMFVPPTFSGGAYLSNTAEMSGSLGLWTEDIQAASFFTGIGMCLFPPFMVPFLRARRVKHTYIACFLLLIVLNAVCAVTTSTAVLLTACLLTGFVRIIVMLNCTFTIAPYLTGMDTLSMFTMEKEPSTEMQYILERKRTFLMPVLYLFILMISQLSNMLTAWFAYEYHWQDAYSVVIGMLLVAILLVTITMPDEEKKARYRIEWCKVPEMLLMTLALCSMTVVCIYGKTLDWLDSDIIVCFFAVSLLSFGVMLLKSSRQKDNVYLPLGVFRYRNVTMAMLLFLVTMILNSANAFILNYARITTQADNVMTASLNGWAIVGCLVGLIVSLLLILNKVHFRLLFFVGFIFMAVANAYMYFQYQTMGLFQNLWLPMVLNFTGLLTLYSIVAAWGMKGLPSHHLATFVFLMILMRNAIAPVVGSAIYTNVLYHKQQHYVTRLSQNVDCQNSIASSAYTTAEKIGKSMGNGNREANQLAATSIKSRIMLQSTILAMKDITGNTVILLIIGSITVLILPYRKHETT